MFLFLFFSLIALTLLFVYFKGKYNEYIWTKRGATYHAKNRILGPFWDFLVQDKSMFQHYLDLYRAYPKEPAVACGDALYVKDLENIQHVMQNDFQAFSHRGIEVNDHDILADNILFMHGPRWKLMRQHMTPLFTAAKLKSMYYIMDKSALDFVDYLRQHPETHKGDLFSTLNLFCNAAIGSTVFGINTGSIFNSPFLHMARSALMPTPRRNFVFIMSGFPTLFKLLRLEFFTDFNDFFIGAIKRVLDQRRKDKVIRNDFADTCLNIQRSEVLKDPATGCELKPTDELLAAQGFFFFLAGVEPTAASMFGVLLELGRHPEMLKRVHGEIDEIYNKYNGKLSYDALSEMKYLDMVMCEAVRLYPPIGFLTRRSVQDSVLPVGNIKVEKNNDIVTPIFEIHHDPKYYPDPEKFDPERFAECTNLTGGDVTYMPFGKGPRMCLGARYARLQGKAGLVHLLRNFSVTTVVGKGGIKFGKEQVQVRPCNVNVQINLRNICNE